MRRRSLVRASGHLREPSIPVSSAGSGVRGTRERGSRFIRAAASRAAVGTGSFRALQSSIPRSWQRFGCNRCQLGTLLRKGYFGWRPVPGSRPAWTLERSWMPSHARSAGMGGAPSENFLELLSRKCVKALCRNGDHAAHPRSFLTNGRGECRKSKRGGRIPQVVRLGTKRRCSRWRLALRE